MHMHVHAIIEHINLVVFVMCDSGRRKVSMCDGPDRWKWGKYAGYVTGMRMERV